MSLQRKLWQYGVFTVLALLMLVPGAGRAEAQVGTRVSVSGHQALADRQVIKPGMRVAVVGDSITEQKLYSHYIELYLIACRPDLRLHVMQYGWGGERASGFANRMDNDLLPYKPDVVTTCYGMNDGGYRLFDDGIGKAYENPMRDIVKRLKAAGVVVVVGSPGAVDSKFFRNSPEQAIVYNDNLAHLRDIARRIAEEQDMPFANVHDAMIDAMMKSKTAYGADYSVCGGDGVHPPPDGHLVMAYAFLKAMGFDGDLGTISVDMRGKTTASAGHKVLSVKGGKVELQSTRYPFCFFGGEKDANGTISMLPYLPFNQDLNRLTLVVKNLGGEQGKVTWGTQSKTFSRTELEHGINLAAEFLDNPFVPAFRNVEAAVIKKENFETTMIKGIISPFVNIMRSSSNDPVVAASAARIRRHYDRLYEQLHREVVAQVVPVTHTLVIEAVK